MTDPSLSDRGVVPASPIKFCSGPHVVNFRNVTIHVSSFEVVRREEGAAPAQLPQQQQGSSPPGDGAAAPVVGAAASPGGEEQPTPPSHWASLFQKIHSKTLEISQSASAALADAVGRYLPQTQLYVRYCLRVTADGRGWEVHLRYSDLHKLFQEVLERRYENLPPFPEKGGVYLGGVLPFGGGAGGGGGSAGVVGGSAARGEGGGASGEVGTRGGAHGGEGGAHGEPVVVAGAAAPGASSGDAAPPSSSSGGRSSGAGAAYGVGG